LSWNSTSCRLAQSWSKRNRQALFQLCDEFGFVAVDAFGVLQGQVQSDLFGGARRQGKPPGVQVIVDRVRLVVERALAEARDLAAGTPPPGAVRVRSERTGLSGTRTVVAGGGHGWSLVGIMIGVRERTVLLLDVYPGPVDATGTRAAVGLLDALAAAAARSEPLRGETSAEAIDRVNSRFGAMGRRRRAYSPRRQASYPPNPAVRVSTIGTRPDSPSAHARLSTGTWDRRMSVHDREWGLFRRRTAGVQRWHG
jgi:hypothetical protein